MKISEFNKLIKNKIVILDGSTGVFLQKNGMLKESVLKHGAMENPKVLEKLQKAYIKAGSDIVYTCTLGGTRLKLDEFGLEKGPMK